MQRSILACAFVLAASAAFAQQQQAPASDPYQGQSKPPTDDVIVASPSDEAAPKPPAGKPLIPAPAQPENAAPVNPPPAVPNTAAVPPPSIDASENAADADVNGTDEGIVGIARPQDDPNDSGRPTLRERGSLDPDGDIVRPHPLRPGELADGTTIRVRLLTGLSTDETQQGEVFRTRVATDVFQDGQVLIPAGAEIDGRVAQVSAGSATSHGTMLLRPDTVVLPDGSRYHLDAQVTGTPGSNTHVSGEGFIHPGSRLKKDSMQYGGGVGAGVVAGAIIAGPVGAITGGLIGAGAITLHLVNSHLEASLVPGTVLLFTLDNRLSLRAANPSDN